MIPEAADYNGTSESTYQIFYTSVTVYSAHDPLKVTNETFFPTKVLFFSLPASIIYP